MSLPAKLTERPIAHRGLWRAGGRPENSLSAFEAACAKGYGIELDVRLTADGEAMVFHDERLERMTVQAGMVEERTADALAAMTLMGGDRQHIPTLAQALALIAGRSLVLVELKTPPGQEGLLEARVAELLEAYEGPAAVLSFNPQALAWMARNRPSIARGFNAETVRCLHEAELAQADFLSVSLSLAKSPHVWTWRAQGRPALAWTVHHEAERRALDDHVDNFMFEGLLP